MTGPGATSRTAQRLPPSAAVGLGATDDVAVLMLVDVARAARLWGWSRIILGEQPLRRAPGLRLAKALGSGHQGGFGLRPSASRQGLFALFDSEQHADNFIDQSDIARGYRARANECLVVKLRATSCRGSWSGAQIGVSASVPVSGPVAALTRASIRPSRAWPFWRHSPASEAALAAAPGCQLAVGLGEAPVLRQATFSVWESQAAMDAYARSGAHLQAIRGAAAGNWFSESMFVRFVPLLLQGRWQGRDHG